MSSATIFYFSSTGNCLALSRKLKYLFPFKSEILNITLISQLKKVEVNSDIIVVLFPVYMGDIPKNVKKFIKKIKCKNNTYIAGIATCNSHPRIALYSLKRLIEIKGLKLSGGFIVDMPGNALLTDPEVEKLRLQNSEKRIKEIADFIIERKEEIPQYKNFFWKARKNDMFRLRAIRKVFNPKLFLASDDCISCEICKRVCPTKNINMVLNKPNWHSKCIYCLACFHWCPKEAIIMNNRVIGNRRKYHYPEISLEDIILD